MKNKEIVWTSVQFRIGDVTLCVDTNSDLTQRLDVLKNSGYIEIAPGRTREQNIFWDGVLFLINCNFKDFKLECEKELREKNLKPKETFKTIKKLIKKACNLNLLTK